MATEDVIAGLRRELADAIANGHAARAEGARKSLEALGVQVDRPQQKAVKAAAPERATKKN